jgi:hypothetical protein
VSTGWPEDWKALVDGQSCSMCANGGTDDNGFGVRIQAATYSDAYLQRADMQRGYTIVIWRGRHVVDQPSSSRMRRPDTGARSSVSLETPEGERRTSTEIDADEVGASLKFHTAKLERAHHRATTDRSAGREAERGQFNDEPPF